MNKPNTRIAVLSFDDSQEHIDIKLCDINSRIIWQKTNLMPVASGVDKLVGPAFNDEGNHLAVVLKNRIEIVDARNGSALDHISIEQPLPNQNEPLQITAVGIGHSTNNVVIPKARGDEIRLDRVILPRSTATGPILVASMSSLSDLSLAFTAPDRKVIAVGKRWGLSSNSRRFFAFGWDSHTRVLQYNNAVAPEGSPLQSPICTITWKDDVCIVLHVYNHSQSLHVVTVHGNGIDMFDGESMLIMSGARKVLILQRRQILVWSDEMKPVQVGNLEWDRMPPVHEIDGRRWSSEIQIQDRVG